MFEGVVDAENLEEEQLVCDTSLIEECETIGKKAKEPKTPPQKIQIIPQFQ